MKIPSIIRAFVVLVLVLPLSSCLTRRTVTQGGQTVEDGYVIRRPIKEAIQNTKAGR